MKNTIIEILSALNKNVDFENENHIIDNGLIDSFSIIRLVSMLEDEFDVEITASDLIPENFNSVDAIANMIENLED